VLQLTGYIIRRLLQAIVVVLGVTMIAFGMEHLLPDEGRESRRVIIRLGKKLPNKT